MSDIYTAPARRVFAITASDSTEINARGFYVGVSGDVSIVAADDSDPVTLKNVVAGVPIPISVKKVRSTGTTATDIVGLV